MTTAFMNPGSPEVLRSVGITVIGHDFEVAADQRQRLVLRLDSPAGEVRLTDAVDGSLQLIIAERDADGLDALVDAMGADADVDVDDLGSALDDMLTAATTRFRRGLDRYKDLVAASVVDALLVELGATEMDG